MKKSSTWQRASKEIDNFSWCGLVQPLEVLKADLEMEVNGVNFSLGKDKCTKATQEYRGAIQSFHSQSSSRVALMTAGQTSRKNSMECLSC